MDYKYADTSREQQRGVLIEVHIADLHFGAFNPKKQYDILMEQFIKPVSQIPKIDIISVDGDIFDHKVMSNSDVAMYATMFIDQLVQLANCKNSYLILLAGTFSHDYDQLKLFYHYMESNHNVIVVTSIQMLELKGARILCIPELYNIDESVYQKAFFHSGYYDTAFVHGTYDGSVYGNNAGQSRLLTEQDFIYCKGVAISGHVHKAGCFNGFYYYCGCPYRWKFGEEESKGYLLVAHDLDTQIHYAEFQEIKSDTYITIYVDELLSEDPQQIISYIDTRKHNDGIDYIKVRIRYPLPGTTKTIINQYYHNSHHTFVEFQSKSEQIKNEIETQIENDQYNYLIDDKISDIERFVRYVNENEGEQFITVDELKKILSSEIL